MGLPQSTATLRPILEDQQELYPWEEKDGVTGGQGSCRAMLGYALAGGQKDPSSPPPSGKGAALLRWEATVLSDFSSPQG